MGLRKTATIEAPYATYKSEDGTWIWKVLKVNQPGKSPDAQFSTWMVAAQSPATFGGWDYGDTYSKDVLRYGYWQSGTDEFEEYLRKHDGRMGYVYPDDTMEADDKERAADMNATLKDIGGGL